MSDLDKYLHWIERNVPKDCLNLCGPMVSEMAEKFPELRKACGEVLISTGYWRPHWWLVAPDGEIIDPTVAQFSSEYYGLHTYVVEYNEFDRQPTGKCPQCGEYCFDGEEVHEQCFEAYKAYVMGC